MHASGLKIKDKKLVQDVKWMMELKPSSIFYLQAFVISSGPDSYRVQRSREICGDRFLHFATDETCETSKHTMINNNRCLNRQASGEMTV